MPSNFVAVMMLFQSGEFPTFIPEVQGGGGEGSVYTIKSYGPYIVGDCRFVI